MHSSLKKIECYFHSQITGTPILTTNPQRNDDPVLRTAKYWRKTQRPNTVYDAERQKHLSSLITTLPGGFVFSRLTATSSTSPYLRGNLCALKNIWERPVWPYRFDEACVTHRWGYNARHHRSDHQTSFSTLTKEQKHFPSAIRPSIEKTFGTFVPLLCFRAFPIRLLWPPTSVFNRD